ncbi:hypothetical protein IIA15_07105 [candidate division TA06 bacterium]|nr:hypothetical protein [candidate division TA06 bacterium]
MQSERISTKHKARSTKLLHASRITLYAFFLTFYVSSAFGVVETFDLEAVEGETLSLSHPFVLLESEEVFLIQKGESLSGEWLNGLNQNGQLLKRERDYTIDYEQGIIVLKPITNYQLPSTHYKIGIRYHFFPFQIRESYHHKTPSPRGSRDPPMRDTNHESRVTSQSFDPPTPSTLFLSGSKSLGITFGSGQNLSLDQSLRVNITGRVEDVEVNAVLSDENTLLQPEGTTETLESLDEVLVEIKSTSGGLSATLGDYNLSLGESEFGRVERRLQGGMAGAQFSRGSVLLAGALSRGKFTTNRFFGVEGRQGPYPLVGKDGEREIVVIAGSEKIYLDEILLKRGERNGYTIDYSSAEITFTPRVLITPRSRILVEFEYFTEEYRRSLYGGRGTSTFDIQHSTFNIGTTFFREGDSPNSPIGVSLSDEDRAALSIAGDDTSKAWVSGAALVDSGLGDYVQKGDTFEFVGYQQGNYLVTFTDVGDGNGEYEFIGNGFQFVGPDSGRYVPRIRLPLPNRKSFLAFDLSGEIAEGVQVRGEVAGSERDLNVLSSRDDGDNLGKAGSISFDLNPEAGLLPGSWGRLGLKGKFRSVEERFEYPGRGRDLQYEDRWNVKVGRGKENLGEVTVSYGRG